MGINKKDEILKDCSRCAIYNHQGKRLAEARVVHTNNKVCLYFSEFNFKSFNFKVTFCKLSFFEKVLMTSATFSDENFVLLKSISFNFFECKI